MLRRIIIIVCLLTLAIGYHYWQTADPVFSLQNPTIPTRTPTPRPATATPKSGGGSDNPAPTAVSTDSPPTATATEPSVTIAVTPVGGFIPTAEACSTNATVQAINPTNLRAGPSVDYEVVGKMVYLEVRFIVGRAADAPWWLIQLEDGSTAWVADEVVLVYGYANNTPVVAAPPLGGATVTPGTPWNPTPPPSCTVTPTNTPEPTATSSPTVPPTTTPELAASSGETTPTATETVPPTEIPPTQTAVSPPTLAPTDPPEPTGNAPTAVPTATNAAGAGDLFLPIAGGALILIGVIAFIVQRRRQPPA